VAPWSELLKALLIPHRSLFPAPATHKENITMYEAPKLSLVGEAKEVILGIVSFGDDIDGFCYPGGMPFAEDPDLDSI